jgi:succinylarginine dihydrolase
MGIALLDKNDKFGGWIGKRDLEDAQNLLNEHGNITVFVEETKEFMWEGGGGRCWRGRAVLQEQRRDADKS